MIDAPRHGGARSDLHEGHPREQAAGCRAATQPQQVAGPTASAARRARWGDTASPRQIRVTRAASAGLAWAIASIASRWAATWASQDRHCSVSTSSAGHQPGTTARLWVLARNITA
ncbi:MAG: hypothetical protein ACRDRX_14070 [Pseudonocardiaceae bacterium]